jgi:hypothetical protein
LLPQGKYAIVGIHCERMDLDDRRAVIKHGMDFGRLYSLAVDLLVFEDGIQRSSHSDPDHRATASVRSWVTEPIESGKCARNTVAAMVSSGEGRRAVVFSISHRSHDV